MSIKLIANLSNPPISGLAVAHLINTTNPVEIVWGKDESALEFPGQPRFVCHSNNDVLRALARHATQYQLYGETAIERTQIDHWLSFSLTCEDDISWALSFLDKSIAPVTYLVANKLTIADFALFNEMHSRYTLLSAKGIPVHVQRWYDLINAHPHIQQALQSVPKEAQAQKGAQKRTKRQDAAATTPAKPGERKQEGKFDDLEGAELGKVVVRFPPEASGYLHIGHAKAALLNQYYAQAFQGKLIMRFDDTNPAKETVEFENVILGDLELLQIKPDIFTHTSNYFDLMLGYCEQLLKEGKAYVDDTPAEQMKLEREQHIESSSRANTPEKNLTLWQEMVNGTEVGQKYCVRAKIDMSSPNGCMRDPTIYRCKNEPHPRTGTKYKVYPTYDFACPIVDAIENVTHTLRTTEYHDRDDQFFWFIDALKLRKPYICEYSRLNMTNTVLSKRKLTWFVDSGLVDGWDDPRFPTVRGIVRRGMTVEGLKEFIIAQGFSKAVVFMNWDKIWAFNKKVIDPIAPRYTALDHNNRIIVNVDGAKRETIQVAVHPKNEQLGKKCVTLAPKIYIDYADAEALKEGENATFINWGNILIKKVHKDSNGRVVSVDAALNLDNKDFKKTLKLTWLAVEEDESAYPPTYCVYFENIISKAVLGKGEDFKQYIGHKTREEIRMLGDPELKKCKKGDIIQLQRRGFFKVDNAYAPPSGFSDSPSPVVLFFIPDGHTKEMPTSGLKINATTSQTATKTAGEADASSLNDQIVAQGNIVRDLKTKKAPKVDIDAEVETLKSLKAQFKNLTGQEWKPGQSIATPTAQSIASGDETERVNADIVKQGNLIRELKAKKSPKAEIDPQVETLKTLKAQFKSLTGQEWKPGQSVPIVATASSTAATPVAQPCEASGEVSRVNAEIVKQGNLIRELKGKKAPKAEIDPQVETLKALKAQFKTLTGLEWKPGQSQSSQASAEAKGAKMPAPEISAAQPKTSSDESERVNDAILKQGNLIRELKAGKAPKTDIDSKVEILKSLKAQFKTLTGQEWKPVAAVVPSRTASTPKKEKNQDPPSQAAVENLLKKYREQSEKVLQLKASIQQEDNILLALQTDLANLTGKHPLPTHSIVIKTPPQKIECIDLTEEGDSESVVSTSMSSSTAKKAELTQQINQQGEKVRGLKASGASKDTISAEVEQLKNLKSEYKAVTGEEFPIAGRTSNKNEGSSKQAQQKPAKQAKKQQPSAAKTEQPNAAGGLKKQTRLGLEAKKEENLPDWYTQVITKGELIEYYDVSGCYILRPWAFAIWKAIRTWFDAEITKFGVKECYFPIFVSKGALEREKAHIADFSPEVAWVTKSGDSDLAEPIAIRPTSETVMYPAYAKWLQSYRDLPIKLNQWNNVVRWEFKHPQPFLRTREFLWQEGHSAYATQAETEKEVLFMLDRYAQVYTDLLAIPVVKGRKTEKEKFAGGVYTTTVEAFISASGRAIQGATSHYLGQNFSKMFDIVFEDPETQQKNFVHQCSWGMTTRTIGVLIMVHADNRGLVLPPRVACTQVVVVPCGITVNTKDNEREELLNACAELEKNLVAEGIRCEGDYRDNYSPGWKFNHWELKGVPIRIEVGPKDVKAKQVIAVRRDTAEKITLPLTNIASTVVSLLNTIHESLLYKAQTDLNSHTVITKDWVVFCNGLDQKNILLSPFCGDIECEEKIKAESARGDEAEPGAPAMGAKSLCTPFEQPASIEASDRCIHPSCNKKPTAYTLFGRSY